MNLSVKSTSNSLTKVTTATTNSYSNIVYIESEYWNEIGTCDSSSWSWRILWSRAANWVVRSRQRSASSRACRRMVHFSRSASLRSWISCRSAASLSRIRCQKQTFSLSLAFLPAPDSLGILFQTLASLRNFVSLTTARVCKWIRFDWSFFARLSDLFLLFRSLTVFMRFISDAGDYFKSFSLDYVICRASQARSSSEIVRIHEILKIGFVIIFHAFVLSAQECFACSYSGIVWRCLDLRGCCLRRIPDHSGISSGLETSVSRFWKISRDYMKFPRILPLPPSPSSIPSRFFRNHQLLLRDLSESSQVSSGMSKD